jgi:hypothetical protein
VYADLHTVELVVLLQGWSLAEEIILVEAHKAVGNK